MWNDCRVIFWPKFVIPRLFLRQFLSPWFFFKWPWACRRSERQCRKKMRKRTLFNLRISTNLRSFTPPSMVMKKTHMTHDLLHPTHHVLFSKCSLWKLVSSIRVRWILIDAARCTCMHMHVHFGDRNLESLCKTSPSWRPPVYKRSVGWLWYVVWLVRWFVSLTQTLVSDGSKQQPYYQWFRHATSGGQRTAHGEWWEFGSWVY